MKEYLYHIECDTNNKTVSSADRRISYVIEKISRRPEISGKAVNYLKAIQKSDLEQNKR